MSRQVEERSFFGLTQLSFRALLIGAIGSAVITASSMYVALRMSALPWPTVLAAILAMALLKLFGKTTPNEINITQTAMTAGAMVAGGLAFTLPGLWLEEAPAFGELMLPIFAVALGGVMMGTALTWVWRPKLLNRENLPFPIGIAAAETISAGDVGGFRAALLLIGMAAAAIFTLIRDWLGRIPSYIAFVRWEQHHFYTGMLMWPMAPAIGYMIGTLYSGVLFIGGLLAYLILIPIGLAGGWFSDVGAAFSFKDALGLGLMVGSGIGVVLAFMMEKIKATKKASKKQTKRSSVQNVIRTVLNKPIYVLVVALTFVCTLIAGIDPFTSVLVLTGVFLTTLTASLITGQAGINPMEIFAILVLIGARFITGLFQIPVDVTASLLIAAVVAVACGYAGDTLFDYKAGVILKTNPKAQLIAQIVGGLVGAVTATVTIFLVIDQYGPVGSESLPAAQGLAVFNMVGGTYNPVVFWLAALAGALLVLIKVPAITLGIGFYLPFGFSLAIAIGGLIRWIVSLRKKDKKNHGLILASGLFGGESLIGVILPMINFFSGRE